MFGNKSKVSPGKQKQGQRKKKKKVANKINKDGEFIPSNVQHQDETFINKPHSLLIDGVAKATTVHMTLTLGSQGQGRNDVLIYNIYDEKKRRLCTAQEISNLKGGSRPFLLTFMNDDKEVAFTLERAKNFILCCFGVQCCGSVSVFC
ncbi:unnamed protein product [Allacma fusca]|uniref:Tubby C-terminal domain-containing protein n=1 Tax=Allacma fusca TaxID=39272 RepID=A0A8J2KUK2_9HEXA|nr:unnamed protein product [Allacma fusca]